MDDFESWADPDFGFGEATPRPIILLSGPSAAGKNTIAAAIARLRPPTAVIDVDSLRAMLANPHHAPWEGEAGREQQLLGVDMAAGLSNYLGLNGWEAVILDVVSLETEAHFRRLLDAPPFAVVLLPPWEETERRNAERERAEGHARLTPRERRMIFEAQAAYAEIRPTIDPKGREPEDVAREILALFAAHLETLSAPSNIQAFAEAEMDELLIDLDPGDW